MDILVEFEFPDGTEYYAWAGSSVVYNGRQYVNIINSINSFSENMGDNKSFEFSDITIICNDFDRRFRNNFKDVTNRFVNGCTVNLRKNDGTLLKQMVIDSWSLLPHQVKYVCSNKMAAKDFAEKIDKTKWPDCVDDAVGETVPMAYNTVERVKAWKVNTLTDLFLLSKTSIREVTRVEVGGVEIDAQYWSIMDGGTYYYIDINTTTDGDFAYVDVRSENFEPVDIIEDILDTKHSIAAFAANDNFRNFISNKGYNYNNVRYLLNSAVTAKDLLKEFCNSFECNYRFNDNDQIEFVYVDTDNLNVDCVLHEEEIINFGSVDFDAKKIKNRIRYRYDKDYEKNKYSGYGEYYDAKLSGWGEQIDEVEFPFLAESVQAEATAYQRALLNWAPKGNVTAEVALDVGIGLKTGSLIRVYHEYTKNPAFPLLHQIVRRNINFEKETVSLDLVDYDFVILPYFLMSEDEAPLLLEGGGRILL